MQTLILLPALKDAQKRNIVTARSDTVSVMYSWSIFN
jgi:hypothetical protein